MQFSTASDSTLYIARCCPSHKLQNELLLIKIWQMVMELWHLLFHPFDKKKKKKHANFLQSDRERGDANPVLEPGLMELWRHACHYRMRNHRPNVWAFVDSMPPWPYTFLWKQTKNVQPINQDILTLSTGQKGPKSGLKLGKSMHIFRPPGLCLSLNVRPPGWTKWCNGHWVLEYQSVWWHHALTFTLPQVWPKFMLKNWPGGSNHFHENGPRFFLLRGPMWSEQIGQPCLNFA